MGRQAVRLARLILPVVLAAGAIGCSTGGNGATGEVAPDAACIQFRRVVTDTAAGRLTESGLRAEFEEIHQAAQEAGTDSMADAAQRVVDSLTAGDMIAFEQAFRDMDAACSEAGF